jgi:hypothetical protein
MPISLPRSSQAEKEHLQIYISLSPEVERLSVGFRTTFVMDTHKN